MCTIIHAHSFLHLSVENLIAGFLWQLLCEIARQHGNSLRDNGCQTDGSLPPQDSLSNYAACRFVFNESLFPKASILVNDSGTCLLAPMKFFNNKEK